jgi:hypothetical protein
MNDIERAIRLAGEIENALARRGATGNGLREKAECFEKHLPADVWPALRRLGWQRNQIAHGRTLHLEDPRQYERDCRYVLEAIIALPANAQAQPSPARAFSAFRLPRRAPHAPRRGPGWWLISLLPWPFGRGGLFRMLRYVALCFYAFCFIVYLAWRGLQGISSSRQQRTAAKPAASDDPVRPRLEPAPEFGGNMSIDPAATARPEPRRSSPASSAKRARRATTPAAPRPPVAAPAKPAPNRAADLSVKDLDEF